MNAIRQVYDELPASISMPKSLQTHHVEVIIPVSYTHLTLPTIYSV